MTKEFYVAGVKFRKGWKENLQQLEEGQELQLLPEPTNLYDKFAVKIMNGEIMLGYVPKIHSPEVSAVAEKLKTTIIGLSPDFEPWTALKVRIEEVDDSE